MIAPRQMHSIKGGLTSKLPVIKWLWSMLVKIIQRMMDLVATPKKKKKHNHVKENLGYDAPKTSSIISYHQLGLRAS
jgi:hypothetical protein